MSKLGWKPKQYAVLVLRLISQFFYNMCLQLDLECRVPHGDLIYSYNLLYIGSKALMGTSKKLVFKQMVQFGSKELVWWWWD